MHGDLDNVFRDPGYVSFRVSATANAHYFVGFDWQEDKGGLATITAFTTGGYQEPLLQELKMRRYLIANAHVARFDPDTAAQL